MESFLTRIKDIALRLKDRKIVIVGKGPSIDFINSDLYNEYLVIGLNDAERITNCHISILYDDSFLPSISSNGFKSDIYLSPFELDLHSTRWILTNHNKLSQNNIDLMFRSLTDNDLDKIIIYDVLFITALRIAFVISKALSRPIEVYMLGFDFDYRLGRSIVYRSLGEREFNIYSKLRISPQENYFKHAIYLLNKSEVDIIHVGNKNYSQLSTEQFNKTRLPHLIKPLYKFNNKIVIVAELTTNHFGDRKRLRRMIQLSKESGADLVKVQKRDVESFYSKADLDSLYNSPFGKTFRDYRLQLELSLDDFKYLDKTCKELDIGWFASILDLESFEFIKKFNPSIIKIPSTISNQTEYIDYVFGSFSGDIVVSTGMSNEEYISRIIDKFNKNNKLYLMHTNSSYPTPDSEINIAVVEFYNELSKSIDNLVPAYSSHDDGSFGSIMAVAAGAKMIEKHVKIGVNEWAHFDSVALDLENGEFKDYVNNIRKAEVIYGSNLKVINPSENHKYNNS